MFLVYLENRNYYVFCLEDPRGEWVESDDGEKWKLFENVGFHCPEDIANGTWTGNDGKPISCLGRNITTSAEYRVFHSETECRNAGYSVLGGTHDLVEHWPTDLRVKA